MKTFLEILIWGAIIFSVLKTLIYSINNSKYEKQREQAQKTNVFRGKRRKKR